MSSSFVFLRSFRLSLLAGLDTPVSGHILYNGEDIQKQGLDSYFKKEFAGILALLKEQGVTVFMISHDIEFCASYADRCGLFFDGNIVACGTPGEFFAGNNFYTTAANRMARRYFPMAVTEEDVVECLKKGV